MRVGIDCRPIIYTKAGIAEYATQLIENSSQECDLFLYAPSKIKTDFSGKNIKKKNLRMPRVNSWAIKFWESNMLPWACEHDKIDVFCGMRFWAPKKGCFKKVVTIHDVAFKKIKGLVPQQTEKKYDEMICSSLDSVDHFITVSHASKEDFCSLYQVPEDKVSVVYNGYDKFYSKEPYEHTIQKVRNKFKLNKDYYLFVGTIEPRKNLIALLHAFEESKTDLELVIAGGLGWEYSDFMRAYEQSPVKNKIKFTGYVTKDELSVLYRSAAAFVFPSLYEGFGIPVLEAMSTGLPVLCANNSSLGELFADSSVQVDANDIKSIASGLNEVLLRKKELSTKSIAKAKEFSWQKSVNEYYKIISGL